jgi:hypothetical protein
MAHRDPKTRNRKDRMMKASQIKVGGKYIAKVSGKLTTVRVDSIRETGDWKGRTQTRYDVTNLETGRRTTFRSASKLRSQAPTTTGEDHARSGT